jgi:calcineurin-like phosphoesterase family protein
MTEAVIENVNKVVKENDTLLHLGDWSFGGIDNIKKLRHAINCKNVQNWLGNHDKSRWFYDDSIKSLFQEVYNRPVNLKLAGYEFILWHYSILQWDRKHHGVIHCFGHSHNTLTPWINQHLPNAKMKDVGLDCHPEFRPFNLDEILAEMNNKVDEPLDHHNTRTN